MLLNDKIFQTPLFSTAPDFHDLPRTRLFFVLFLFSEKEERQHKEAIKRNTCQKSIETKKEDQKIRKRKQKKKKTIRVLPGNASYLVVHAAA